MALNFLNTFKNTKTRTLVLVVGSTLVAGVIFLITNIQGKDPAKENPSKVIGVPREAQSVPGAQTSEQYRKLLAEENKKRAEEAEKDKKSAIPTFKGVSGADANNPFGANGQGGPNSQFGLAGAGQQGQGAFGDGSRSGFLGEGGAGAAGRDPFGDTSRGGFVGGGAFNAKDQQKQLEQERQKRIDEQKKRLTEIEEDKRRKTEMEQQRKELDVAEKQYQQSVQEAAGQMANYAKGATTNWVSYPPQAYVQGVYAEKGKDKDKNTSNDSTDKSQKAEPVVKDRLTGLPINKNTKIDREIIKAGTVLYGVLDTAINSDESGPVLATIVSGKYKGGRLIGKIQLPSNAKKVIITFSNMSIPSKSQSVGIEAYAIDPDTARTAFASDVDNHYLLRYGSLFASSFMEGFGKAVGQQGTTTTDPSGGQTQTKPQLSPTDQIYAALGTVGEKWSKQVEPIFKTPVTVTVNQGLGVGVLFMRDIDVGAKSTDSAAASAAAQTATTPNK